MGGDMDYWTEQDDYGNWYVVSDHSSIPYGDNREDAMIDCDYWNYRSEYGDDCENK